MVLAAVVFIWFAGLSAAGSAAEDVPDWQAVGALFALRCVNCHAAQGAALGLRLDSYEAALAGGERGPVLIAGDAAGSELVRRLRGESVPRMPFLSRALPAEEIELVVRWVEAGLPRGEDGPAAAR
jgi:mono/diheme cytochrome c family protein